MAELDIQAVSPESLIQKSIDSSLNQGLPTPSPQQVSDFNQLYNQTQLSPEQNLFQKINAIDKGITQPLINAANTGAGITGDKKGAPKSLDPIDAFKIQAAIFETSFKADIATKIVGAISSSLTRITSAQ